MFEKLEQTFDLIPAEKPKEQLPAVSEETAEEIQDREDRDLARQTYKKMIKKSENMLEVLSEIAAGTEHPRAFEVAANLVKTISEVAARLDDSASKSLKSSGKNAQEGQTNNISNHLYVGSSEELMKMIRQNK